MGLDLRLAGRGMQVTMPFQLYQDFLQKVLAPVQVEIKFFPDQMT